MEKSEKMTIGGMSDWMYRKNFLATEYIWQVVDGERINNHYEYYVRKINESTGSDPFGFPESKEQFCETCYDELAHLAENHMWNNTCRDYIMGLLKAMEQYHLPEVTLINGKSYSASNLVNNWNLFHAENPIETGEWDTMVY